MKRNRLSMSFVILAGVIALSVLVGLPQVKADSYTIYATDTATQNDAGITVYYGDPGDWMLIQTIPSSQGGNGFIKFDLSEIPDGSIVTNATLYLGLNSINVPPGDVGIYYGPNDNWSLNQLDNPIGFDPNLHVGNFHIESGGFEFIPIALDPGVYDFQPDINDNALTLAIVVDDSLSNPGLYFYLWGSNTLTWRPYLVIDVTPIPVCDIQMSQASYVNGETVTAQVLRIANPTAAPLAIELKLWFDVPAIPPISFVNIGANGDVVLPAGFEQNFGPLPLATVTEAFPRGTYGFNCRMLHPVTGGLLNEDLNPFDIQ